MKFISTRQKNPIDGKTVSFLEAVKQGLAPDGGLYMPVQIPKPDPSFWTDIARLPFTEMATRVLSLYLKDELSEESIHEISQDAFSFPVTIQPIDASTRLLELFHGPTLAFKDFGARFMARVYAHMVKKSDRELTILAATSGDTGSAVAHGFYRVPGVNVILLYPSGGVSPLQEKQMTTLGENITALEIDGVFDDCQRLVKWALTNQTVQTHLQLSSANSINIARLLPQSLYYIHARSNGVEEDSRQQDVTFCVPSGNFGNLTAGLLAQAMGLPGVSFIAATNSNHTVPDYLSGAVFQPRKTISTISNAMDVGNPSNFERMMHLFGHSDQQIRNELKGGWATDEETLQTMEKVYRENNEHICPHTAVGVHVADQHRRSGALREDQMVIVPATAHPVKFTDVVQKATGATIPIPTRVQDCMNKKKSSINMSTREHDLQDFLLSGRA